MDKQKRKIKPNIDGAIKGGIVRRSGFKTIIHAHPLKEEIDELIMKYHWSSREIEDYLKKKYPNEYIPSNKTIDNYRKKYAPEEHIKAIRTIQDVDELIKQVLDKFNPIQEAIEMWQDSKNTLKQSMDIMKQTGIPPRFLFDAFKTSLDVFQNVLDVMHRFGLINQGEQKNITQSFNMLNVVLSDKEKSVLISSFKNDKNEQPFTGETKQE
jgi:hypothetical protein